MPARIVTSAHRPKRPLPKRKAVALQATQPAIVTARKPGKPDRPPRAVLPDMTPEEHHRRGDAADALWRRLANRLPEEE
jgi:hypothetical protein